MKKLIRDCLILILILFPLLWSFGLSARPGNINVLLVNSYHRGYQWTDSINAGIQKTLKSHPEITLYIDDLDAKKFGQTKFELEKKYIEEKFAGIKFSGIIVTDNDALDLIIKYKETLFPQIPVVFAGISNPKNYHFEGTEYFGFEESANSDSVIYLIRKILPDSKKIMVLVDNTTTGKVYRKEFAEHGNKYNDLIIDFPDSTNIGSIYNLDFTGKEYDAVFYAGISQDIDGSFVEPEIVAQMIGKGIDVPIFSNDPKYLGGGILGGTFQSGLLHGEKVMELLIKLINSNDRSLYDHINFTKQNFFFDANELSRFNIPVARIPDGALVINKPTILNKKYFFALISALALLVFIVLLLSYAFRKTKKAEKEINKQFEKIQHQNQQLEDAQMQLNNAVSELENANKRLKETNINLLEAKKKAEESDNLKSAFLANVSHEIRTPLNSIVGFSSLLCDSELNEETRNSYTDMIESNTESLLVLIDEIIDLSKIETQQLALKMQDFSIDSLIDEMSLQFNQSNKNQELDLRTNKISAEVELFVFSDRIRVKQIFINLLTNAMKFTESGYIEFGYFQSEKKEIVLFVRDTGIGIKKEHHQAIFHRFRKLNENSAKIYRGTGLGLAITQKLVELLGGEIWIDSEPGRGSVFYFTLKDLMLKEITA